MFFSRKHPSTPFLIALIIAPFFALVSPSLTAAEATNDSEMDALMKGFDSPPAETQQTDIEDAMMGFDDAPAPVPAPGIEIETPEKRKMWDFTTLTSLSGSYNYQKAAPNIGNADYRGLSRLKVKLQPEFRYKFNSKWSGLVSASAFYDLIYRINDRSDYATETLDNGETELEFREAYLLNTELEGVWERMRDFGL